MVLKPNEQEILKRWQTRKDGYRTSNDVINFMNEIDDLLPQDLPQGTTSYEYVCALLRPFMEDIVEPSIQA